MQASICEEEVSYTTVGFLFGIFPRFLCLVFSLSVAFDTPIFLLFKKRYIPCILSCVIGSTHYAINRSLSYWSSLPIVH